MPSWLFVSLVFLVFLSIGGLRGEEQEQDQGHLTDEEIYNATEEISVKQEPGDETLLAAVLSSMAQWKWMQWTKKNNPHARRKRDEEVVCYQELGCFRDEGPFDYLDLLPAPPDEIGTKFLLFTRLNPSRPQMLHYSNLTSTNPLLFNTSKDSIVIVHGFGSSCSHHWAVEMRTAILAQVDSNVMCVDWEKGAGLPNYVKASVNTRLVGKQLGLFIQVLGRHLNYTADRFHIIGFSLGAHVSGFAGTHLQELEGQNLTRITGLDPAGPLFESYENAARLDSGDASFVDVIHSNGDSLIMGGLGSATPMGDVDFYPNGGRVQKGCHNLFVGAVTDFIWSRESEGRSLCNHRRAYKFFAYSLAPQCPFPSFVCESYEKFLEGECFPCGADWTDCGNMGYYANVARGRGTLYLVTRDTEPFCGNQYKVTVEISSEQEATYGRLEVIILGAHNYSETFPITWKDDEEIVGGERVVKIIVPHPAIGEDFIVQIRYIAYKGWIYNGKPALSIHNIHMMDSYGKSKGHCSKVNLLNEIPHPLLLTQGSCTYPPWSTSPPSPDEGYLETNRIQRFFSTSSSDDGNGLAYMNVGPVLPPAHPAFYPKGKFPESAIVLIPAPSLVEEPPKVDSPRPSYFLHPFPARRPHPIMLKPPQSRPKLMPIAITTTTIMPAIGTPLTTSTTTVSPIRNSDSSMPTVAPSTTAVALSSTPSPPNTTSEVMLSRTEAKITKNNETDEAQEIPVYRLLPVSRNRVLNLQDSPRRSSSESSVSRETNYLPRPQGRSLTFAHVDLNQLSARQAQASASEENSESAGDRYLQGRRMHGGMGPGAFPRGARRLHHLPPNPLIIPAHSYDFQYRYIPIHTYRNWAPHSHIVPRARG